MKDQIIYNKKEICKAILISAIFINLWPLIPSGNFLIIGYLCYIFINRFLSLF